LAAAVDLEISTDQRLAEEGTFEGSLELLAAVPDGAVLCSHGDVIPDTIAALQRRGCQIDSHPDWRKGTVWTLDRDADGTFVRAKVWSPAAT
jgi:8-oxo-dGTP diphosphatase